MRKLMTMMVLAVSVFLGSSAYGGETPVPPDGPDVPDPDPHPEPPVPSPDDPLPTPDPEPTPDPSPTPDGIALSVVTDAPVA